MKISDIKFKQIDEAAGSINRHATNASEICCMINYNSIFSTLLKEAAKCKQYNADIIIDLVILLEDIVNSLKENCPIKTRYFGFRECGVDHKAFIVSRLENVLSPNELYFAMYKLQVELKDNNITMILYRAI